MRKAPQYILDFIEQHSEKHPPKEIALLLNKEFGCNYIPQQVSDIKSHYKFSRYKNPIQNPALRQFVCDNVKGKSLKELTELVNKTFKTSFSEQVIHNLKTRLKLKSGIDARFKKGHVSSNKGKKGWCPKGSEKTWFKKGNIPANHKPIGSERIDKYGYISLKVKEPNVWMLKHRYLYEKYIGKIPSGATVSFKDGNRQNLNLDNLILITRKESAVMSKKKLWSKSPELTQAGHTLSKIIIKTTEIKEKQNEKTQ